MILLDYKDRRPIYEQVVAKLEELMLLGVMKENEPLPSVRMNPRHGCSESFFWK